MTQLVYRDQHLISVWLSICLLLVAGMVVVGGYTRLSGSGLSITEWKPVHGAIPPLNEAEWQEEFAAYQQSPQYHKINKGMSVDEFKTIYWPEYFHRLLGRTIGFVMLVPLLIFMVRQSISRQLAIRLGGIFLLGGLQGAIGWLMVKSGLVDNPYVSPFRLALHLSLAFAIFGLLLWSFLDAVMGYRGWVMGAANKPSPITHNLKPYLLWFTLLCFQIILGAMVAGLHAGLVYNTWPMMNEYWLPPELLNDQVVLVQFIHRWLAVLVAVGFLFWWYKNRAYAKASAAVAIAIAAQFTLGVLTLIHVVPLPLALAHQAMALALFAAAVVLMYKVRHCEERSDEAIQ